MYSYAHRCRRYESKTKSQIKPRSYVDRQTLLLLCCALISLAIRSVQIIFNGKSLPWFCLKVGTVGSIHDGHISPKKVTMPSILWAEQAFCCQLYFKYAPSTTMSVWMSIERKQNRCAVVFVVLGGDKREILPGHQKALHAQWENCRHPFSCWGKSATCKGFMILTKADSLGLGMQISFMVKLSLCAIFWVRQFRADPAQRSSKSKSGLSFTFGGVCFFFLACFWSSVKMNWPVWEGDFTCPLDGKKDPSREAGCVC